MEMMQNIILTEKPGEFWDEELIPNKKNIISNTKSEKKQQLQIQQWP
jgi:hypothetical protein